MKVVCRNSPHPAKATLSPHPMRGEGRVRGAVGHSTIGFIILAIALAEGHPSEQTLPLREHDIPIERLRQFAAVVAQVLSKPRFAQKARYGVRHFSGVAGAYQQTCLAVLE